MPKGKLILKEIKDFTNCSCVFEHSKRGNIIFMSLMRKGRVFFKSSIRCISYKSAKEFINTFTEDNARDLFKHDILHL